MDDSGMMLEHEPLILEAERIMLKSANVLADYVKALGKMKEHYIIIIAVSDTACKRGAGQTLEALDSVPTEFRKSFIFVSSNGQVLFNQSSGEKLEFNFDTDFGSVSVASMGFSVGKKASVKINEEEICQNKRGLNIVVMTHDGKIVDNCAFDLCFDVLHRGKKSSKNIANTADILDNVCASSRYNKVVENFFWAYGNGEEALLESKKRFFMNMPKATGYLRMYQECLIGLLSVFGELCQDAGVQYSLMAGSLLGAVRHNDFIPWDDDVDTMMLFDDYLKLVDFLKHSEKYQAFELFHYCRGRLLIQRFCLKGHRDIFIDIFCHGICDGSVKKKMISKLHRQYRRVQHHEMIKCADEGNDFDAVLNKWKDIVCGYLGKISKKDEKTGYVFVPGFSIISLAEKVLPIDMIYPLKRCKFGEIEVFIPSDADAYLREAFRDHYSFPPRKHPGHHTETKAFKDRLVALQGKLEQAKEGLK